MSSLWCRMANIDHGSFPSVRIFVLKTLTPSLKNLISSHLNTFHQCHTWKCNTQQLSCYPDPRGFLSSFIFWTRSKRSRKENLWAQGTFMWMIKHILHKLYFKSVWIFSCKANWGHYNIKYINRKYKYL